MPTTRNQLIELIEQGRIPSDKIDAAVAAVEIFPDGKGWLSFIDRLLMWIGGLALAFSAMFFIAYNWDELGRFTKFGMVEALVILAVLAYWKLDEDKVAAKVALLMASIFLGVLLALYGQTYQTGADPWQLFFNWALLMLPWAVIGRFPVIWILWLSLLNITAMLYASTFLFRFFPNADPVWLLFALNSTALVVWELLSNRWSWLAERWAVRLLAVGSGLSITWLSIFAIFESHAGMLPGLIWPIWMLCMYFGYRKIRQDLFMLAGTALSGIVVIICFVGKQILHDMEAGGFFILAIMIIGMGTGAAIWLRNLHREFQS